MAGLSRTKVTNNINTCRFVLYLPVALYDYISSRSEEDGVGMSAYIRNCIRDRINTEYSDESELPPWPFISK